MSQTIDTVPAFHIEVGDYVGITTVEGYAQGFVKRIIDLTDTIELLIIDEYEDELEFVVFAMDTVDLLIDEN